MSADCRDLLLRLLERNPETRITFTQFFSHGFVDLEHMAGPDSLGKAVSKGNVLEGEGRLQNSSGTGCRTLGAVGQ